MPVDIELYSMNGVLLQTQISETPTAYLDLSNFQAGMYIFKTSNNQQSLQQKLIVW